MLKNIWKNKEYHALIIAILISYLGDTIFDLFIVWKITIDSENVANAAYMLGSSLAFRGVLSLGVGILIDRFNKKKLMIFSNIVSAIIILLFMLFYDSAILNIYVGIGFILANDICNTVFGASSTVLFSEKFDTETFIKIQSSITIVERLISTIGSLLTGWLLLVFADWTIFLINILSFLLSAIFICGISYEMKHKNIKISTSLNSFFKNLLSDIKITCSYIISNSLIRSIVLVIFLLNLAYGIIPNFLPIMLSEKTGNPLILGTIKSMLAIGEIIGLLIVSKYGHFVSRLFKISMIMCSICMLSLIFSDIFYIPFIFLLYGLFDSITQPLFNYGISNIEESNRGKILGGMDTVLLLSPSIGLAIGTKILTQSYTIGFFYLALIFVIGFVAVTRSRHLSNIKIEYKST